MKNIVLSAVAVLTMSSFAVAGGDIAPVEEPIVVVEEPMVAPMGNFYLGLAYSYLNAERTQSATIGDFAGTRTLVDQDYSEVMLQAGYNINQYVAIEGRYWFGIEDSLAGNVFNDAGDWVNGPDFDQSIDAWGIYVKPQYPVTEAFNVYALLGYASAEYTETTTYENGSIEYTPDADVDGFSWGLGANYAFSENVSIFVDYVCIYDDTISVRDSAGINQDIEDSINTWNIGVTYNF